MNKLFDCVIVTYEITSTKKKERLNMRKWVRRLVATVAVTALGALALPTTGFAANSKTPIIVGSKSFTESKVVS